MISKRRKNLRKSHRKRSNRRLNKRSTRFQMRGGRQEGRWMWHIYKRFYAIVPYEQLAKRIELLKILKNNIDVVTEKDNGTYNKDLYIEHVQNPLMNSTQFTQYYRESDYGNLVDDIFVKDDFLPPNLDELIQAGFSIESARFVLQTVRDVYTLRELKTVGFDITDWYLAEILQQINYYIKHPEYTKYWQNNGSVRIGEQDYEDDITEEKVLKKFKPNRGNICKNLRELGFTVKDIMTNLTKGNDKFYKFTNKHISVIADLYVTKQDVLYIYDTDKTTKEIVAELLEAGFIPSDFKHINFLTRYLRDLKVSAGELKVAGFTAGELKTASFKADELNAAGFSAGELKTAGFKAGKLKVAGFTAQELKDAGFLSTEVINAGFEVVDLKKAGYTLEQLVNLNSGTLNLDDLTTHYMLIAKDDTNDLEALKNSYMLIAEKDKNDLDVLKNRYMLIAEKGKYDLDKLENSYMLIAEKDKYDLDIIFKLGKYKYGDIKKMYKKLQEQNAEIISSVSNQKTEFENEKKKLEENDDYKEDHAIIQIYANILIQLNNIEDKLAILNRIKNELETTKSKLKKKAGKCPKLRNLKRHTNPDCIYPDIISS